MLSKQRKIPILLVDDDKIMLQHLKQLVPWEDLGFTIVGTALNGKQALSMFSDCRPRLILTDVIMPIMNGIELIQNIKKKGSNCHFLILSSYDEFSYAKAALQLGVTDYLLKNEITAASLTEKLQTLYSEIHLSDRSAAKYLSLDLQNYFRDEQLLQVQKDSLLYPVINQDYHFVLFTAPDLFRRNLATASSQDLFQTDTVLALTELIPSGFHAILFLHHRAIMLGLPAECSSLQLRQAVSSVQSYFLETFLSCASLRFDRPVSVLQLKKLLIKWENVLAYHLLFEKNSSHLFSEVTSAMSDGITPIQLPSLQVFTARLQKENGVEYLEDLLDTIQKSNSYTAIAQLFRSLCTLYQLQPVQQISCFSSEQDFRSWVLQEYRRWRSPETTVEGDLSFHVKNAVQYIESHYMNASLSIEEISEEVGISSGRLGVLFKKELGKTPGEYLTDYRIKQSIQLLLNSNYKIFEIANRVGYNSSQYFSQIFFNKTGKKPLDYRKSSMTYFTMGGNHEA